MSVIRPTHTCFDDAMDLLELRVRKDPAEASRERLVLVHAICIIPDGPEAGERFAHAWVEEALADGTTAAWQDGYICHPKPGVLGLADGERISYAVPAEDLRLELRVVRAWSYTLRQVWEENQKSCTYGPWVPELRELCRKKKDRQPATPEGSP